MTDISTPFARNDLLVQRLSRIAKQWGGCVEEVADDVYDEFLRRDCRPEEFSDAPFSSEAIGVVYRDKKIIFCPPILWTDLIHEMGHVFACDHPPSLSDEYTFFGWEYSLVRHIRADVDDWQEANSDYSVSLGETFGSLSPRKRSVLLQERVLFAKKAGLIKNGRPVSIR